MPPSVVWAFEEGRGRFSDAGGTHKLVRERVAKKCSVQIAIHAHSDSKFAAEAGICDTAAGQASRVRDRGPAGRAPIARVWTQTERANGTCPGFALLSASLAPCVRRTDGARGQGERAHVA